MSLQKWVSLLLHGRRVNGFQRDGNFDEFLLISLGHVGVSAHSSRLFIEN